MNPQQQSPVSIPKSSAERTKLNISNHVDKRIFEIIPSTDPLDDPNFNTTDHINQMFPTEQSLQFLDQGVERMKMKISRLNNEVSRTIEQQSSSTRLQAAMETRKEMVVLQAKIDDMKRKAVNSQNMVMDICQGIHDLDTAKKNITTTITLLKRLHMLGSALQQLESMLPKKAYSPAGGLILAIQQLSQHFEHYHHNPTIQAYVSKVDSIQEAFKKQIYKDFEKYWDYPQDVPPTALKDACSVMEALGKTTQHDFMVWFTRMQLGEYNRYFKPGEEQYALEQCERRFAWIKKALMTYDEQHKKMFPASWKMDELLCEEFCFITRQAFEVQLENRRSNLPVELFLSVINKTLQFEKEMCERFGPITTVVENVQQELLGEDSDLANPHSVAAIKARYKKFQHQEEMKKKPVVEVQKFEGIISSSFELYMDLYIRSLDGIMQQKLEQLVQSESWSLDDDDRLKVLTSSTKLVIYFQQVLKETLRLSKNQALFETYLLLKKYFEMYANRMSDKIPSAETKLSEQTEKSICLIINTSDYLKQNTSKLGESLKQLINRSFAEKISFASEQEKFEAVIAKAIQGLVSGLIVKLDPAVSQLSRMPWSSWQTVEDQSEYVNQIAASASGTVPTYSEWIVNVDHFRFLCDSFIISFVSALTQAVYKCKRISEIGAQQLLVDATGIKSILLSFPNLGRAASAPVSAKFSRRVNKEMSKIEATLRVILTSSPATITETFKTLIPDGDETELQRIMELKGISRAEQKSLLESYLGELKSPHGQPLSRSQQNVPLGSSPPPNNPTFKKLFEISDKFAKSDIEKEILSGFSAVNKNTTTTISNTLNTLKSAMKKSDNVK